MSLTPSCQRIVDNLIRVRKRIEEAAQRSNRTSEEILLLCVTKGRCIEEIQILIKNGVRVIGENRVGEALEKFEKFGSVLSFHMIGHLQRRKVKDAVKIFDLIHSVDSVKLAYEIDKRAGSIGKCQDVLIEVNVSGEETKYGFHPGETIEAIREISRLPNIRVLGLMTMALLVDNPELTRPVFRALRLLKEEIDKLEIPNVKMQYLSMGMTQDFEIAIEEGANIVRIGTAIFS